MDTALTRMYRNRRVSLSPDENQQTLTADSTSCRRGDGQLMDPRTRDALGSIRLSWAATADDIWHSQGALHVPGLNDAAFDQVLAAFTDADRRMDSCPLGVVVRGQAGSGKSHLLGQVRERVQAGGGFFFLVEPLDATGFWDLARRGVLESLLRPAANSETQLKKLLRDLAATAPDLTHAERRSVVGDADLTPETLSKFLNMLHKSKGEMVRRTHHTLRALVLLGANDPGVQDVGQAYLHSAEDLDDTGRRIWGIGVSTLTPQEAVRDISQLVAIAGPAVLAIDQIDTLLAPPLDCASALDGATFNRDLERVAHGLMSIRQTMRRTAAVVACQPTVWESIGSRSIGTAADRFRATATLKPLHDPKVGREIVERRFTAGYKAIEFVPPYPSWPFMTSVFDGTTECTPRQLLRRVDAYVRSCLARDVVEELTLLKMTAPESIRPVSRAV